jgi:hypothetical protein
MPLETYNVRTTFKTFSAKFPEIHYQEVLQFSIRVFEMKKLSKQALTIATVGFWQRLQCASSFQIAVQRNPAVQVCRSLRHNDTPPNRRSAFVLASTKNEDDNLDLGELKVELQAYLQVREEVTKNGGGQQSTAGKTVGGTRGNKLLEYVSAPVPKEMAVDAKYPFDYDELTKYGYSRLVKPIMKMGGRVEVYKLMNMTPPPMSDVSSILASVCH